MSAGYSGTPLVRKLGLRDGMRARAIDAPPHYGELIGGASGVEWLGPDAAGLDLVHAFVTRAAALDPLLPALRERIQPAGAIWISWPKRASKVPTDVTEDVVRDRALAAGLVDVKVCAVDEVWSGLKLVIRLRDRP